ncbi:MAG: DUF1189 family protein [Patescibacteria group bacterium]
MQLIQIFKQSVYSPDFYRELKDKPLKFSIKYFYLLAVVLSVIWALILTFTIVPIVNVFITQLGPMARDFYPAELVITVQNGQASANVSQPYLIKMPVTEGVKVPGTDEKQVENILAIDTVSPFDPKLIDEYKAAALLTKDYLVMRDDNVLKVQKLADFPNLTIDQDRFSTVVEQVQSIFNRFAPVFTVVVSLLIFLGMLVAASYKLLYLLLLALLIMLIGKIKKLDVNYKYAYRIGIHAMSLGLVLSPVLFLLHAVIPYLFTILLLVMAWANLKPAEQSLPLTSTA